MDDDRLIADIRERVTSGQYETDFEHVDYHVASEGFTLDDVEYAVGAGAVIETAPERNRWLFCGTVPSLRQDARFLNRWLHVSVEYDGDAAVTVVTAYRPDKRQWRTARRRR
jgi:hypothetical protein